MSIAGLDTPVPKARHIMKFDKPGSYQIRIITYESFLETWLPVVTIDGETGKFASRNKSFQIPDDNEIRKNSILTRLANAERAIKKEMLGPDNEESKRSIFSFKRRYRLIGFDKSGLPGSDPNILATFDFGPELEAQLYELAWGTKKKYPTILEYGPLWAYDIYLTRKIVPKTGNDMWDTKWFAEPVEKIGPFEGKLTTELLNADKRNEWLASIDFSKFFTEEQYKAMDAKNMKEELVNSLRYTNNEEIVENLIATPLNLSAMKFDKPAFIPSVIGPLMERLGVEARTLKLSSPIALLAPPENQEENITVEDTSVEIHVPEGETATEEDGWPA